jgi:replicative DNA helicase
MFVIDHLKLVRHSNSRLNKFDRMEEVCIEAKGLAKELDAVCIILAQRTRESLKRDDATPLMTDIDGGGALEQQVDLALCLFRRDRWLLQRYLGGKRPQREGERTKRVDDYFSSEGKVEIHTLKRRRGQDGQMRQFRFNGAASRLDPEDER